MRFALLLLAALNGQAQNFYMDLSGEWQREDGRTQSLPRKQGSLPIGGRDFVVLEKAITVPAEALSAPLFLTIGSVSEVYEVSVNGRLIGRRGVVYDMAQAYMARPQTFPVPAGLVTAARNVITLRLWRRQKSSPGFAESYPRLLSNTPDWGPYALHQQAHLPPFAELAHRAHVQIATPYAFAGLILACLALVLFRIYVGARDAQVVLGLAMLLGVHAWQRLQEYAVILTDRSARFGYHGVLVSALSTVALAFFVYQVSAVRTRLMLWAAAMAFLIRAGFWYQVITLGPYELAFRKASAAGFLILALVSGAVVLLSLVRTVRQSGWRNPATHLHIVTTLIVFLDSQRVVELRFLNLYYRAFGMIWHLYDYSLIVLSLVGTTVLLRQLVADRREKQRLAGELEAARNVQQLLVPAGDVPGVQAVYLPAQEVGGDFYQALALADGSLLVVVGDVSGKGLRAAMIVALVVGAIRNRKSDEPARLLEELNQVVAGNNSGGFVTAIVARVRPDGDLTIANAGHLSPYLDGQELALPDGLPLGVAADAEYESAPVALRPGGTLVLLSDGIVEAADPSGALFGFDRTAAISRKPAKEIAAAAQAWGQNDDITVVTVRRSA